MLTAEQIIKLLKDDVEFHVEMELANDNSTYGYFAHRLNELVELLEDETQHERLLNLVENKENN